MRCITKIGNIVNTPDGKGVVLGIREYKDFTRVGVNHFIFPKRLIDQKDFLKGVWYLKSEICNNERGTNKKN